MRPDPAQQPLLRTHRPRSRGTPIPTPTVVSSRSVPHPSTGSGALSPSRLYKLAVSGPPILNAYRTAAPHRVRHSPVVVLTLPRSHPRPRPATVFLQALPSLRTAPCSSTMANGQRNAQQKPPKSSVQGIPLSLSPSRFPHGSSRRLPESISHDASGGKRSRRRYHLQFALRCPPPRDAEESTSRRSTRETYKDVNAYVFLRRSTVPRRIMHHLVGNSATHE